MCKGNEYFLHSLENLACLPKQKKNPTEFELLMSFEPRQIKMYLIMLFFIVLKCEGLIMYNINSCCCLMFLGECRVLIEHEQQKSTQNLRITYTYIYAHMHYCIITKLVTFIIFILDFT